MNEKQILTENQMERSNCFCSSQPCLVYRVAGQQCTRYNVTGINERIKGLAGLTTDAFNGEDDYKDFKAVSVTVTASCVAFR